MKNNLLIIHKDEAVKKDIHDIISRFDFKVTYASDGLHGIQTAKYIKPDLIIVQVDLPVLNGIELAIAIRKDQHLKNTPIIFLHKSLDLEMINYAKELDAKAFLIKPYIDNSLIYAIKRGLCKDQLQVKSIKKPVAYAKCLSKIKADYQFSYA